MVSRKTLIILSGLIWILVGLMLFDFARVRFLEYKGKNELIFIAGGVLLALIKYRFAFMPMVDRNLKRLYSLRKREPLYLVLPKSVYKLILIMAILGISLRWFKLPGEHIAVIDIAVGLGLLIAGVRHFIIITKGNLKTGI